MDEFRPVPHVVFVTRTGLLEPLGQSQVMSYLRGLSRDYRITLITCEKAEDMADSPAMDRARADCKANGIAWNPRRFPQRSGLTAKVWSLLDIGFQCFRVVRLGRAKLLHARSYLPAAVAWCAWRVTAVPFVFDMRALWPEELITAGRLRRGSLTHRALEHLERVCLRDAANVVALTEVAVEHLRARYPNELAGKRVAVIPTCADLDRFRPAEDPQGAHVYGSIGTVLSGWFKPDWLGAFFRAVARHDPEARFEVVTRDDADAVRRQLDPDGSLQPLSVFPAKPGQVHQDLQRHIASAMFYAGGETSELARSPTRLAEILGCGIPVVANEGVGDVARILRHYRVGVVAHYCTDNAMDEAVRNLTELRTDPETPARCRRAAEELYSLSRGIEAYKQLYAEVLSAR